jgi:hypothetical protein
MRGSIAELGIPALIDIAERMAGGGEKILPPNDIPLPEFRDVTFAYATPGASDPQLGLVGSGFKLGGELYFMGHELGKADISAGPSGVKMDASVDPIDLKILKLEKNQLKMDIGFKSLPKLEIDSQIEFLGAKEDVLVKFDKGMVDIGFEAKIGGGIWDSTINLGYGVDGAAKGVPDIFIEGKVKSDFFAWLKDKAPEKVHEFFNKLNAGFEAAKEKINSAETVVRNWNSKIQARKEAVQREKANADAAIHSAENRVNSVKHDADYAHGQAEHHKGRCKWYRAWECAEEAYWWVRYGVEYAAYKVAEGVLHAAQSVVDHLPSELMDPQLTFLEGKQAIAMAALELAKLAINGIEAADKWIDVGLETLLKEIGSTDALVIKEIFFEGDMDGMLKGQPMIISIDLEIFGDDLGMQTFAFKLMDPVFNAEQLAFIPLHMVSELFGKIVPKSLKKLLGPVLAAIDSEANKAQQKAYEELKSVSGMNLPPEVKEALESAMIERDADGLWSFASADRYFDPDPYLKRASKRLPSGGNGILVAANTDFLDDSGQNLLMLAQATPRSATKPGNKPVAKKVNKKDLSHADRFAGFKEKRRNLLANIVNRNKGFGENLMAYQNQQKAERAKNENDMFVAHTDVKVPPGVLFTQRLLVARHSKLCLGRNAVGKTTFHPCNESPGGLLWSTNRRLVNLSGHLVPWDPSFAKKFPNRVYTELIHNGACLTTPFHLAAYDAISKQAHAKNLTKIAKGGPGKSDAHLTLAACRKDGRGQLWKVVKLTHANNNKHGFKLQERDSGYCLRPDSVKAHTKKQSKEVKGVFYPCTGIAHGTFELTIPNDTMPIWYDHNGVIKSDNGYCLDVPNDPAANADSHGSVVYLKKCANDEYDRWDYVVEYDKTVKIINDFTGHCLYPYDQEEGKISEAHHGQLVQRPCDGRYGQGWQMRVIPKQKWFQLEAMDSSKKATGTCMIPDKANPGQGQVNVYVKTCLPATRGRWQFGHWKGTYEWTEWTSANDNDLSSIYWVSKDDLANNIKNGVCRAIIGFHSHGGTYDIYPGTWHGGAGTCSYLVNGALKTLSPSQPENSNMFFEVLSGLDIGVAGATGSWKSSAGGVPFDATGQNATPPTPRFSSFLVGGDSSQTAFYLCRVKSSADSAWRYGYQTPGKRCMTEAGTSQTGVSEVLVFKTVENPDTSN